MYCQWLWRVFPCITNDWRVLPCINNDWRVFSCIANDWRVLPCITMYITNACRAPLCNLYFQTLEQPMRARVWTCVLMRFHFSTFYAHWPGKSDQCATFFCFQPTICLVLFCSMQPDSESSTGITLLSDVSSCQRFLGQLTFHLFDTGAKA